MAETTPTPAPEDLWQAAIKAMVGPVANLSATVLICVMFYQSQADLRTGSREDRTAYREDLRVMHSDAQRQWEAIAKTQASVEALAQQTQQLAQAIQSLTAEVRELKTARQSAPPSPRE